jgi:hypothetical protein
VRIVSVLWGEETVMGSLLGRLQARESGLRHRDNRRGGALVTTAYPQ